MFVHFFVLMIMYIFAYLQLDSKFQVRTVSWLFSMFLEPRKSSTAQGAPLWQAASHAFLVQTERKRSAHLHTNEKSDIWCHIQME